MEGNDATSSEPRSTFRHGSVRRKAGTLTFTGGYTQTSTGQVIFDIGGPTPERGYPILDATAAAYLEGSFSVNFLDAFVPSNGEIFDLFQDAGGITIGSGGLSTYAPAGLTGARSRHAAVG